MYIGNVGFENEVMVLMGSSVYNNSDGHLVITYRAFFVIRDEIQPCSCFYSWTMMIKGAILISEILIVIIIAYNYNLGSFSVTESPINYVLKDKRRSGTFS